VKDKAMKGKRRSRGDGQLEQLPSGILAGEHRSTMARERWPGKRLLILRHRDPWDQVARVPSPK
jgi:hypothetical protein